MKTIYMTKGLPGSGKTYWAREKLANETPGSVCRVNKDDLRAMMHNGYWSGGNEKLVLKVRDQIIREALDSGQHVIVDDTNLHPKHEATLSQIAKEKKAKLEVVDFTDVPISKCHEQNQQRANPVPAHVIDDMWAQFLKPEPDLSWQKDGLLDCVIVDLDGTLALMDGRGPYDWGAVHTDKLNAHVAWMLDNLPYHKVILSGRDSVCRDLTEQWLADNAIQCDELYMRAEGDNRKDSIVKKELFDTHIRGRLYPQLVLDDREQVVRMWRDELGLTVWQVADGKF